jgi:hypothetical protein
LAKSDLTCRQRRVTDRAAGNGLSLANSTRSISGLSPECAYKRLMQRLGGVTMLREKIRAWLVYSRDCRQTILDVVQEVIQEMLQRDRYIQHQVWIDNAIDRSKSIA